MTQPSFLPLGDTAITVEFSRDIDATVNARVLALYKLVVEAKITGLIEALPTYRSLMVQFNPLYFDITAFKAFVLASLGGLDVEASKSRRWIVPVCYERDYGWDVAEVAAHHNLTEAEVIALHSEAIYRVYMIGFLPGFAYLGGLNPLLAIPRRVSPRAALPAGNISIGGIQALVASVEAPSGWYMLGQTPMKNYDATRPQTFLLEAGDEVVFKAISSAQFVSLAQDAASGAWVGELL